MRRLPFALLAFSVSSWATLPQTVRWNVEKTIGGSDTNGGGFDTTKAGTDYSQSVNNSGSCAAYLHIDGSTVTATANATTVTFTGGTHTVASGEAGNIVFLATGSGLTVGWYEISSVNVGAVQWTLERTTGMSGGAITGNMGGCLASPQQAMTNMGNAATSPSAIDQIAYIKAGTSAYTLTTALTMPSMAGSATLTRFAGYATSQTDRGLLTVSAATNAAAAVFTVIGHLLGTSGTITLCDVKGGTGSWAAVNGVRTITLLDANTFSVPVDSTSFGDMTGTITVSVRPLITTNGNAINGLNMSVANSWHFENLILDGSAGGGSQGLIGINITAAYSSYINVWVKNFASEGLKTTTSGNMLLYGIEVSGCGGTTAQVDLSGSVGYAMAYSYIHDSTTKSGVRFNVPIAVIGNVIANNAGATSDGMVLTFYPYTIIGNLFYGNGRSGIYNGGSSTYAVNLGSIIVNNRFEYNGVTAATAYGFDLVATSTFLVVPWMDYNEYFGNKTAAVHGIGQGTHDVIPSGDPSVARGGAPPNFGLNSTAGAGKALQSVAFPGLLPGLGSSVGYADIGPLRHQDPASTGGSGSYSWVR